MQDVEMEHTDEFPDPIILTQTQGKRNRQSTPAFKRSTSKPSKASDKSPAFKGKSKKSSSSEELGVTEDQQIHDEFDARAILLTLRAWERLIGERLRIGPH